MFADYDCAWLLAPKLSKDLRALAIETLAELDIRRDWLRPPIAFNISIFSNVAHGIGRALEHRHLACEATKGPRLVRISRQARCPQAPQPKRLRYYVGNFPDAYSFA